MRGEQLANGVTLHDLIEALANAVIEAQDRIERHQTANISRYFTERGRPIGVDIVVPSIRPDAEDGEEDLLRVPMLSLVNATRLSIKDVEVSMEVTLGSLAALKDEATEPAENTQTEQATEANEVDWKGRRPEKAVALDLGATKTKDTGPVAKITLRVESQEQTEGMARLLQELNKRIGVSKTT
tara:strand:+ start:31 stop:582 length:552 start_codon:yes stop_codon:yes gene_type:complete